MALGDTFGNQATALFLLESWQETAQGFGRKYSRRFQLLTSFQPSCCYTDRRIHPRYAYLTKHVMKADKASYWLGRVLRKASFVGFSYRAISLKSLPESHKPIDPLSHKLHILP